MPGADAAPLEDSGAGGNARWRSEAEKPGKTQVSGAWCTPGLAVETQINTKISVIFNRRLKYTFHMIDDSSVVV